MGRALGSDDLEDLVQEVFLRTFTALPTLRDPTAIRSFVIGVTLRVAATERRRRRSRCWLQLTSTGELPETGPAPETHEPREAIARLSAILDSFSPESYRAIELRYLEGKELTEVARAIDVSLATVKRRLARASARLRSVVKREPALAGYLGPRLAAGWEGSLVSVS
jgi:RNA polymerase sigma-70 factor (ECF subfamily)